jgi:uncharacterized protein involved in exopolysaccharide biosynthesis
MSTHDFDMSPDKPAFQLNLKDVLAAVFRYKRTAALCFFGILTGAILVAVFQPAQYSASTKFLVGEGRVDPVVTTEANVMAQVKPVTEEDLNSEIELLRSPDVLSQVVVACGLDAHKGRLDFLRGNLTPDRKIARAVARLAKDLKVETVKKSDLIQVTYVSTEPQTAAQVLRVLADAYMQKHVAVHSPPGQFQFFAQETDRYQKDLADAEAQLKQFSEQQDGVAPTLSRDITLQKLSEFRASLQQTREDIAGTEERIKTLEKQAGVTPERITTAKRESDDAQVLMSLKATLTQLELKRTELLTKYQPTYPLVQEVDKEIRDTQASIASEEANPLKEETTDRNATYAWINEELAKAKAEHSGLLAKATATQESIAKYEALAHDLEQKGLTEQDLQRTVKADEENYLLYLRKREQARMSEALDRTRILNVSIAEQPVAPTLPSNSPFPLLAGGIFLALVVAGSGVFLKEYLDPSFRTPAEVSDELKIPVLAAVPHGAGDSAAATNGHANGSGNGFGRSHDFSISEPSVTSTGRL